ncbi:MAG: SRPBCC family protein [Leptospiraceae bacterium]|nr:SRPBCC family protein [Leptospiraceae bacterium]
MNDILNFDSERDLVLERLIAVPVDRVWAAWTEPELLKKWFCPRPWQLGHCEVDLRPGGLFRTVMRSPEGEEYPSDGCYLEVNPQKRLIFTDTLGPGYRPSANPFMTAIISFESQGQKTLYRAVAMHASAETAQKHEEMGFSQGWSAALDQLVECMS